MRPPVPILIKALAGRGRGHALAQGQVALRRIEGRWLTCDACTGPDNGRPVVLPDLVVIYLGMRVNSPGSLRTLISLGAKIRTSVQAHPDGLLLHENLLLSLFPPHAGVRQYWRDFDSLERWARALPHRQWWQQFLRDRGGTGFWHDTYFRGGQIESAYIDMPRIGLAKFAPVTPARGSLFSARRRLDMREGSEPPPGIAEEELYRRCGHGDPDRLAARRPASDRWFLPYRRGMPPRKRPTREDAATARRILLDGLARDTDILDLVTELAPLHPRNNTFPGEVFLGLAADALDWCSASRADPLALEGLRERFLPESRFRGRQHKKFQFTVLAAAALHGGTQPDLLDEIVWWQTDDFWQYALFAVVAYIRAAASRAGVPVRQACQDLAPRPGHPAP